MFKSLKIVFLVLFFSSVMFACGDSNAPEQKMTATATDATAVQLPAAVPDMPVADAPSAADEIVYLPSKVVYQEEIYKNWPYTQAPAVNATDEARLDATAEAKAAVEAKAVEAKAVAEAKMVEAMAQAKAAAEAKIAEATVAAEITATTDDKPYQVVDGKISANAVEGWKIYNGSGCGACHGKGGAGAVGPNLGNSVATKLSKTDFVNIVTNGKSGTLMRPFKNDKRLMANLYNLYAYLVARGDGVLGPGNLIKSPLGK